jgi:hypothetical protein
VSGPRYWLASLFVVIGHAFLDWGNMLSVDAFEANFDGSRPFGRIQ